MKTLNEIIDIVKDGGKPEYDELRYALLAMCALHYFDSSTLMNLWQREKEGKYKPGLFGLEWEANESFTRAKLALNKSPKDYLGSQYDPDTEEYQRFHKIAKGLLQRFERI